MSRPRYQMTDDDVAAVHRWVRSKFHETAWPHHDVSLTAWDQFPLDNPTTTQLQQWCDRFLDAASGSNCTRSFVQPGVMPATSVV